MPQCGVDCSCLQEISELQQRYDELRSEAEELVKEIGDENATKTYYWRTIRHLRNFIQSEILANGSLQHIDLSHGNPQCNGNATVYNQLMDDNVERKDGECQPHMNGNGGSL